MAVGKYIREGTVLCCTLANAIIHGPNYDIRLSLGGPWFLPTTSAARYRVLAARSPMSRNAGNGRLPTTQDYTIGKIVCRIIGGKSAVAS
jgi:hypothetical protein